MICGAPARPGPGRREPTPIYITAIPGHADVNTSQLHLIVTHEGLRRAMESLTRRREPTVTEVPTNEERLPEATAVSA